MAGSEAYELFKVSIFLGVVLLTHVSVFFLYSGKIKSVSDSFRNKLHRVHQRLLRHGETTGQQFVPVLLKGSSAVSMSWTLAGGLMLLVFSTGTSPE